MSPSILSSSSRSSDTIVDDDYEGPHIMQNKHMPICQQNDINSSKNSKTTVMLQDPHVYWNSYLPIFFDRMNTNMRRHMNEQVKDYGITSAHTIYLIALSMHGAMTLKDLSHFLDLDDANTTRVIKVLKEKGLVYDNRDTHGKKDFKIYPTEIGRKIGNMVMEESVSWMDSMMSDVSEEEVEIMHNALLKILWKMEPDFEEYMNCKYQNPFYTYLLTNPGEFSEPRLLPDEDEPADD